MRFDTFLRSGLDDQIDEAARQLKEWQDEKKLETEEESEVRERVRFFHHTTSNPQYPRVGGVDGSGDFPVLSFEDTYVHFAVAYGTQYRAGDDHPEEVGPEIPPVLHLAWIPEEQSRRSEKLNKAFESLAGSPIEEVVEASDYWKLKKRYSGSSTSISKLIAKLVRPSASDSGNLSIQLRSTAELGAARRLVRESTEGDLVLLDGTLSLPFVSQQGASLFHEHLKRLCCVEARTREVGFAALSKSHGLSGMEAIEEVVEESASQADRSPEHWYLRLPVPGSDEWDFGSTEGRLLPPPGAVTYLVRFHDSTPVMRLDIDRPYWEKEIEQENEEATKVQEENLFESIDYMSHDMRSYGYPYPIKAAHDRTSLTNKEREALRSKLVDEAIRRGVSRERLQDASIRTGHA